MEAGDVAKGKTTGFGGKSTMNIREPPREYEAGYSLADNTFTAGSLTGDNSFSSILAQAQ